MRRDEGGWFTSPRGCGARVFVSANVMSHQLAEYAAAGMDGVIAKPLKAEALFAEIDWALAGAAPAKRAAEA